MTDDSLNVKSVSDSLPNYLISFNTLLSVSSIFIVCLCNIAHTILLWPIMAKPCTVHLAISTSLCFPSDSPRPTSANVSVVALNEAGKVRVTWSKPTQGRGQEISGYSVQYRRRGTTSYITRLVSGSSTTSYTIINLKPGTVYRVRVASNGPLGLSGYCCGSRSEKWVTTYNCEWTYKEALLVVEHLMAKASLI